MGTRQPSMLILRGGDLESVDLEPMRRTSLLLPLSLSLLIVIQVVMACKQSVSAVGHEEIPGFVEMYS